MAFKLLLDLERRILKMCLKPSSKEAINDFLLPHGMNQRKGKKFGTNNKSL